MAIVGDFQKADFFDHTGGLNTSDSPFRVADNEATGGKNFEYTTTGGFQKCKGATKINSVPDSQLKTIGVGQSFAYSGTKTQIRAAGTKIQNFNVSNGAISNLTEDTLTASSSFLNSTQPVVMNQFNTPTQNLLSLAGGGLSLPYLVYSASKVTKNGSNPASGSIAVTQGVGTSTFVSTGTYYYAVALRKASTQALSNATLDQSIALSATTNAVTINLTGLTGLDTTKYDQIWIYRSAANGVSGFTTGDLIAQLPSSSTSFIDTGSSVLSIQNVARAGNSILDNSVLPSGSYNSQVVWKRRLVVAQGSTLYCSDVNKVESWPLNQTLTVPSGGPITGLAIVSFTTPTTQTIDELLIVFKDREVWVVVGSDLLSGSLKYIDNVGTPSQSLIVNASGYIAWVSYRGIFMWDGSGKPIYASRKIEDKFQGSDSIIDRSKLSIGFGLFSAERREIVWVLSSQIDGENVYCVRMDLRLSLPQVGQSLMQRVCDTVLITDVLNRPYYGGQSFVPDSGGVEIILAGDASGYMYSLFNASDDVGLGVDFQYETRFHDFGSPGVTKRYNKVIVWCSDASTATLELDYWAKYTIGTADQSKVSQQIASKTSGGYWDFGYWDTAYFDPLQAGYTPLVFNLSANANNSNEGDCLKLRFKQSDANAPVTIAGYSVIWTEASMRK